MIAVTISHSLEGIDLAEKEEVWTAMELAGDGLTIDLKPIPLLDRPFRL